LFKPSVRSRFRDDAKDSDVLTKNPVKDPQVINAKSIPRPRKPAKTLDPALADLGWLVPQMDLDCVAHLGSFVSAQATEIFDSFWGRNNLKQ
jgi:hypothetical protein